MGTPVNTNEHQRTRLNTNRTSVNESSAGVNINRKWLEHGTNELVRTGMHQTFSAFAPRMYNVGKTWNLLFPVVWPFRLDQNVVIPFKYPFWMKHNLIIGTLRKTTQTVTLTLALISGLIFLDPALQNRCYLNLMSSLDRWSKYNLKSYVLNLCALHFFLNRWEWADEPW